MPLLTKHFEQPGDRYGAQVVWGGARVGAGVVRVHLDDLKSSDFLAVLNSESTGEGWETPYGWTESHEGVVSNQRQQKKLNIQA